MYVSGKGQLSVADDMVLEKHTWAVFSTNIVTTSLQVVSTWVTLFDFVDTPFVYNMIQLKPLYTRPHSGT